MVQNMYFKQRNEMICATISFIPSIYFSGWSVAHLPVAHLPVAYLTLMHLVQCSGRLIVLAQHLSATVQACPPAHTPTLHPVLYELFLIKKLFKRMIEIGGHQLYSRILYLHLHLEPQVLTLILHLRSIFWSEIIMSININTLLALKWNANPRYYLRPMP